MKCKKERQERMISKLLIYGILTRKDIDDEAKKILFEIKKRQKL